jgi:hypothetical protein
MMMSLGCALAGLALLAPAQPQSRVATSGEPYAEYGPPEATALDQVAYGSEAYERRNVLTKGELQALGGQVDKLLLVDGTARVLLIPAEGLVDARQLVGRRVEVTGIVRELPTSQKMVPCRGGMIPESKCRDPELPVLPNARPDWPRVSITVLGLSDIGAFARAGPAPEGIDLADVVSSDTSYAGQTVRVVGLFGGRDLLGELPAGSARTEQDWVLRQPPHAIWVTGRKPEGKGWRLDPAYKGDAVRWVEVTGRVEVKDGVAFLRASKVALATAPKAPEPEP